MKYVPNIHRLFTMNCSRSTVMTLTLTLGQLHCHCERTDVCICFKRGLTRILIPLCGSLKGLLLLLCVVYGCVNTAGNVMEIEGKKL